MNEHWKNFVSLISKEITEFEGSAAEMILFSMTDDVGILFSTIRDEMNGETGQEDIIMTIGHLYFNMALMELYWELPPSLYTEYIGEELKDSKDPSVTIHALHSSLMICLSKISNGLAEDDKIEVQTNLNKMVQTIYDICIYFGINTLDPLKESIKDINDDFSEDSNIDIHTHDTIERSKLIKELEFDEIIFEAIIDNRRKTPYKGVSISLYGEKVCFTSGDIIGDFFKCMTHLDKVKKDNNYAINYGPKFRQYLNDNKGNVWSGFLVGHNAISISDMQSGKKPINGVITIDKNARPILMNRHIKDLDSLIDYIDKYKK